MSRYRAPRPRASAYITPAGHKRLSDELKQLWKVERPMVTQSVSDAAKQGDRSENAEYIYGKKRLREIDSRVRFLSKRLDELTVVDRTPSNQEQIFFGAWITLEKDSGEQLSYRLVGPDEFDSEPGYISIDSPMAKALLKKQTGDEVQLLQHGIEQNYAIVTISYSAEI
ncbi:MAG: transcription elongation factor GreB [Pseudomonadales bacterium]|nr:transcription elongation factor GreB [Pseudomonadales bacterium]